MIIGTNGEIIFYHKPWFGLFALPIGLSIEDKVDLTTKRSFEVASINNNDLSLMLKKLGPVFTRAQYSFLDDL